MAKFKYRLQPLLNIKIQKEDLIQIKLANELKKLETETAKLNFLIEKNNALINDYKKSLAKGLHVSKIQEYNVYFSIMDRKIEEQRLYINIIRKNVDKIRDELIKISQERKMLEKLKAKKLEELRISMLRDEQKLIDELVSYKENLKLAGEI